MGKRTNYLNPITKETIWCLRGQQPEGWTQIPHLKQVEILKNIITKEELFDYYIIQNNNFHTTAAHFKIEPENILHGLLKYYNIKKPGKLSAQNNTYRRTHEEAIRIGKKSAETQQKNWANRSEIERTEWSEKQKVAHSTENFKQKISQINKDYNASLDSKAKQVRNKKRSESAKKTWLENKEQLLANRHTTAALNRKQRKALGLQYCRSNLEQKMYECLIEKYPDLKYDQKIDDRYPFFVDFYIPSLDLFIEVNGHPSHGTLPYTSNNSRARQEACNLQDAWLNTYTKRDPEKLAIARQNNLNYIMLYPSATLEENYLINNGKNKDLIKLMFENSK